MPLLFRCRKIRILTLKRTVQSSVCRLQLFFFPCLKRLGPNEANLHLGHEPNGVLMAKLICKGMEDRNLCIFG